MYRDLSISLFLACLWAPVVSAQPSVGDLLQIGDSSNVESSPQDPAESAIDALRRPIVSASLRPSNDRAGRAVAQNVRINNVLPSLKVSTLGPDTLVVGRVATYSIQVTNNGTTDANDVVIRTTVPKWVEVQDIAGSTGSAKLNETTGELTWRVDSLASSARRNLTVDLIPRAGRAFRLNVDAAIKPPSSGREISVLEPKLVMAVSGSDDFIYGQAGALQLTVNNPGTGVAREVTVVIADEQGELATQVVGSIPAGGKRVVDLNVQPFRVGGGVLRMIATGDLGLTSNCQQEFVVRRGELKVDLQGPALHYAGSEVAYQIVVKNVGNAATKEVAIGLSLPAGVHYARGPKAAERTIDGATWIIPAIGAGAEQSHTVFLDLSEGGNHEISVAATTVDELATQVSLVTQTAAIADLKLDIVDPKTPQAVGSDVEYEIHVTNRGTDIARQISVIAVCSPEIEPLDVTGNAAIKSGQIFFRPISQLDPGHKVVQRIKVRALKEGAHAFRVVLKCSEPESRLAMDESTRFFARTGGPQLTRKPSTSKR